ncbi:tectonic-3 [Ornithorhynchus anatinus]|uniref:Tectonic family member 3 n=1 Tax=Ornithorhynchus anatinus TaxID=9258 RepID=F6WR49_ORNAN|nr:tectonic-3 [Ornithorhynchus anatinus]
MGPPRLLLLPLFFLWTAERARPQPGNRSLQGTPSPGPEPAPPGGTPDAPLATGPRPAGSSSSPEPPGSSPAEAAVTPTLPGAPAAVTPPPPDNKTIVGPFPALPICICDLSPNTCDLNCCCDRDCYLSSPRAVFSFCLPGSTRAKSWVCVENSLIFRSNSPFSSRVNLKPNGLGEFCVEVNNSKLNYFQQLQKVNASNIASLSTKYGGPSIISPPPAQSPSSAFYKAGDPILTYFPKWSLSSMLRQPAGIGGLCADGNPAGFLESKTTSCTRIFPSVAKSCAKDPALCASSYYDFTVLKVPSGLADLQNMQVPIASASQPAPPLLKGNTCHNVVSQVIYEIETNGTFGIQKVSVRLVQTNLSGTPGASLQQHFTVLFRPFKRNTAGSPSLPRSGNPGYLVGMPLLALTGGTRHSVSILQSQGDGSCSERRHQVQFGMNVLAGCKLRIEERDCSQMQSELYKSLRGVPSPDRLAVFGNAELTQKGEWIRVLTKNCDPLAEGCSIPTALEMQVLWAHTGLLSNPQAQVLGARLLYKCQARNLSVRVTEVSLSTSVTFTDITRRPEPPRGQPKKEWKLPFDFFFPFKAAFNGGADSSRDLLTASVLSCLLFHRVLGLEMR